MILDGRDSPPKNALNSLKKIKSIFGNLNFISSISGRYYAMDRDKRWERTELFYRTIVFKEGGQLIILSALSNYNMKKKYMTNFLNLQFLKGIVE